MQQAPYRCVRCRSACSFAVAAQDRDIAGLCDGFVNEPGLSDAWLPDDFDEAA